MCTSDSFSQFFRVTNCQGSLNLNQRGWCLSLRHLHYSGSWRDCSPDTFEELTLPELVDVLLAIESNWPRAEGLWHGPEQL